MKKTLLLFLFLCSFTCLLTAEEYSGCDADNEISGASKVWTNEDNGSIKFFKLDEPLPLAPSEMESWLIDVLRANSKTGFVLYEKKPDKLGMMHYRFRQTHNGHVVNNGVYYIHTMNGNVISANGEFYPNIEVDATPIITPVGAIQIGKNHIHSHHWAWPANQFPVPELRIQLSKDGIYHLTYKTDIYSAEPLDRQWLMIDVIDGNIVESFNRIHNQDVPGEAHCRYHGVQSILVDSTGPSSYRLRESTRGGGVETYDLNEGTNYGSAVDFTDSDNIWDSTADFDDAALDAHWGTEMMYDYMFNVHGHESYDGNGAPMLSYVHYSSGYVNAFWDGTRMTYGDGDGIEFFPLTSTEVVGHEIMHGVTEYTAGLIYSGESGGLNESYSDVFGVLLDYQINPSTANFRMGDDFMTNGLGFRNMSDPNEFDNPDTYLGDFWNNGGVHNQSGVQNFWFYLISQGGTGTNDNGDDYTVNAIPMASAADILFRSLSTYLTPGSPYSDARFYGVQSATDLFGDCSDEVINVTNAWYAVGVGDLFNDAVVSAFNASSNFNCQVPANIQFTNNSVNGATYVWDFGNGTTSTDENPTATYDAVGTYSVSLISSGNALCGNNDTLVLTDYITVTNDGGPTPPTCFPGTDGPITGAGVFEFNFETINNTSEGGIEGYQDYTCTHSTNVQEGVLYPFEVETGPSEMIRIWIDADNDGVFNNTNELVYTSTEAAQLHTGVFIVPGTDLYGTPLRLRIKSDGNNLDISDPCTPVMTGQVEDYTLQVSENVQAPAVDFVASDTLVLFGSTIDFTDLTQNLPESWSWNFPGGIPATSTAQHPSVTYPDIGTYEVSLMATNAIGEDIAVKTAYINVTSIATACTNLSSTSPTGLFYDTGGPNGDYGNGEYCTFLIDPGCALEVSLEFLAFNLESGWDYLYVYDGVDETAPLIGTYSGTANPGILTATSGKMYIIFDSDGSVIRPGWEAAWSSLTPTSAPSADFNISDVNPPLNALVDFSDSSTEFPNSWVWDFGDGNVSMEQNPSHAYSAPGTYEVELIVGNCFQTDTITYTIVVQGAAVALVNPSSIDEVIDCGGSTTVNVSLGNGGVGDMIYTIDIGGEAVVASNMEEYSEVDNFTEHQFIDLNSGSDSVYLQVVLNGDYDNFGEFSSLYIEGNYMFDVIDNDPINGVDIIVDYAFGGVDVENWLSDGVLDVSLVNSAAVDDNQGGTNTHVVTIQTSGSSWLSASNDSGEVPVSEEQIITITLDGTGLSAGIYTDVIEIMTNDPNNPIIYIPVTFEILGEAAIGFSADCLNFPPTMQFTSSTLDLTIDNSGCDTLDILSILPNNSEYTVSASVAEILPGESQVVTVTFTPLLPGDYPSNLTFISNVPNENVCLTGNSFGAPAISVNPPSIDVTLSSCSDEVTVPVTVTNTAFDFLEFSFEGGAGGEAELDSVRQRLNVDFASLTDLMPNYYAFFDGEVGNNINDGGGDMYDGGNQLSVDNNFMFFDYSNDQIVANSQLGVDGQYFTRKYPGLFVFAADINGVDRFSIDGNLGADGAGFVSGAQLTSNYGGNTYRGFVKRVFNSNDPSINHLIIVKETGSLVQTIPTTTGLDDHDLDGLSSANRIYYLLFAEANSAEYSDAQMQAIMDQFLEITESSGFATLPEGNYTLDGGASQTFDFVFNTNNTEGGVYNTFVTINSNDPTLNNLEIPVTVNVTFDVCGDFGFVQPVACGGQVDFSSSVVNDPTSYLWDFGDGNTSSEANPSHLYTTPGTYVVTLTVENGASSDVITYSVTIDEVSAPIAACEVGSADITPTFDITNVILNTINNPSDGNSNGYTDYTCEWNTNLTAGIAYDLTIEGYEFDVETVRLWIDFNNNGNFESDELLFEQVSENSPHTGQIVIPGDATFGVPLRMRVACEAWYNNVPDACGFLGTGEFEDYTVFLESNMIPPGANFTNETIDECQGVVQFSDISTNFPTSWSWDFGDGSVISDLQNPLHTFASAGIYDVVLTATNDFGSDTYTIPVTINALNPIIQFSGAPEIDVPMTFESNAPGAISWEWDFGDGTTSMLENPVHTYTEGGSYVVTVTVINGFGCVGVTTINLDIIVDGIEELEQDISLFPNPTDGNIYIKNTGNEHYYEIQIINALGQVLKRVDTSNLNSDVYELTLDEYPPGMYVLSLKFPENLTLQKKFILQKNR